MPECRYFKCKPGTVATWKGTWTGSWSGRDVMPEDRAVYFCDEHIEDMQIEKGRSLNDVVRLKKLATEEDFWKELNA